MQNFPSVEAGQVVLMWSDFNTGHILDISFILATKSSQKVFVIFNDIESALEYAKKNLMQKEEVESTIFDSKGNMLYFFRSIEDFKNKIEKSA